ncbi:hypothetical protein BD309DRAFT_1024616 [Dichomitus squalens]|nr:hypothetical protein BD309DRAFT_1024616 [Dichomitus squalens]
MGGKKGRLSNVRDKKGRFLAVELTLAVNNYVFGITVVGCILLQMNYFNNVNRMYYVGFSTTTIVASAILFRNTDDPANSISLLTSFITTLRAVHLLKISRKRDPGALPGGHHPRSAFESGLMNPQLGIHGRMSVDGWNGAAGTLIGNTMPVPWNTPADAHGRHDKRNSLSRNQTQTLFQAFEGDGDEDRAYRMGLDTLHEVEDDELEADKGTAMRKGS